MFRRYKLINRLVVRCKSETEWRKWIRAHKGERVLKEDVVGKVVVRTVFTGMDQIGRNHKVGFKKLPVVFETSVYGAGMRQEACHFAHSYEEDLAEHQRVIKSVALNGYALNGVVVRA